MRGYFSLYWFYPFPGSSYALLLALQWLWPRPGSVPNLILLLRGTGPSQGLAHPCSSQGGRFYSNEAWLTQEEYRFTLHPLLAALPEARLESGFNKKESLKKIKVYLKPNPFLHVGSYEEGLGPLAAFYCCLCPFWRYATPLVA